MPSWTENAFFYHIYPLGYCGALGVPGSDPDRGAAPAGLGSDPGLDEITRRLDSIAALGVNALYLGPLFESVDHGYDTVDYRRVDRRLGTNADLARLCLEARARGMRVILDGVFNHVGREHPWFKDLRERGQASASVRRFRQVDFSNRSALGDPFSYECWSGCPDLPRLDLSDGEVRDGLIGAALSWIDDYGIDGLRLDAADCLDPGFISALSAACKARKPDFWLMGEVIHGDYRTWAGPGLLDSVTNYECWKGLWSSLADANYFEIAYALNRQSGESGIYRDMGLYNFADNHDVDRVGSQLPEAALLYPLYALLFTMPGIPSLYYGSERGLRAKRSPSSDRALRPTIAEIESVPAPEPDLPGAIGRLAAVRARLPALRGTGYRELQVSHRQLAFLRTAGAGTGRADAAARAGAPGVAAATSAAWAGAGPSRAIVALNADSKPAAFDLPLPFPAAALRDELEAESRPGGEVFRPEGGRLRFTVPPRWARVLAPVD
jgi:glycosidase